MLVIAEPHVTEQSEKTIRNLLGAERILLVLPKWTGQPSEDHPGWLQSLGQRPLVDAQWTLGLVTRGATALREDGAVAWATNVLGIAPSLDKPIQLIRGQAIRPIVAGRQGMLIGEIVARNRRIWVLSDPDVISNQGFGRGDNAAFTLAAIERLRAPGGSVVFLTKHCMDSRSNLASPFLLLFRYPFVVATVQGIMAVALLLWATRGPLRRATAVAAADIERRTGGLLQETWQASSNSPDIRMDDHQALRASETVRDVGRQLHAPRRHVGQRARSCLAAAVSAPRAASRPIAAR